MKTLLCAWLMLSPLAHAAVDDEPPIRKGAMIEVQAWDPKSQTYDIVLSKYPAQGPNYATLRDLVAAVKTLDYERLKKNPRQAVGGTFQLDEELKLQSVVKTNAKRASSKTSGH